MKAVINDILNCIEQNFTLAFVTNWRKTYHPICQGYSLDSLIISSRKRRLVTTLSYRDVIIFNTGDVFPKYHTLQITQRRKKVQVVALRNTRNLILNFDFARQLLQKETESNIRER